MNAPAKILLVGSHATLMGSIAARLECEDHCVVVDIVSTPTHAVRILTTQKMDVVLTDIDNAGTDFFEWINALQVAQPGIRIMLIGLTADDARIEQALAAKVRGFLVKDELPTTVAKAIREVLSGGVHYPPQVRSRIVVGDSGISLAEHSD